MRLGRDRLDIRWYFPDMRSTDSTVPTYGLYGDGIHAWQEDFFHCETIAVRSRRHGWEISPHVHAGLAQMLFVANGQVVWWLAGETRSLAGPVLIGVPRGVSHGFRFSSDVVGFVVTLSQDFIDGLGREDALRRQLQAPACHRPSGALAGKLLALGGQMVEAEHDRFDPDAHRLHRVLAEAWLRTAIQPGLEPADRRGPIARRFQALVETSYREHRPVGDYAARLNCTVRTLSRQTEAAFGMTPLQFINRRLLFEARRLLRFSEASCGEVAAELGFQDPSYFARFYRRMTGRAPSAERMRRE